MPATPDTKESREIPAASARRRARAGWPTPAWVVALLAMLAGCGGGGGGESTPPVSPGNPVSATIGSAGGTLQFTASGVPGRLEFPAGALPADTRVTVTPVAAAEDQWAAVRIEGLAGVLPIPATLTLALGEAPGPLAHGVRLSDGAAKPLATRVGADGRSLVIELQAFGERPVAARSSARPARALAAQPAASSALELYDVAADRNLPPEQRYAAMRGAIEKHQQTRSLHSGLEANLAVAAVLQLVDDPSTAPEAVRQLGEAKQRACTELRFSILEMLAASLPPDLNTIDTNQSLHWMVQVIGPVLYWEAVAQKLGGDPCSNADVNGSVGDKLGELLTWVRTKAASRQDRDAFQRIVKPVPHAAELAGHARILGTPARATAIQTSFIEPASVPLRAIAWETANSAAAGADQAHYAELVGLYAGPFVEDAQMARTSLYVRSTVGSGESLQELGAARGGAGPTPAQTVREVTVTARAGGRVSVDGPIDVLHCPAAAAERLVIDFEGVVVLDRPSAGSRLLDGSLAFEVDALLAAARIAPVDATHHRLHVKRAGSTCAGAFGSGDTVLATITLDFAVDAISREIATVRELVYLDPSDAHLGRLRTLRELLLARGQTQRAESVLGDRLIEGQLYCVHQRAHDECASGVARARAESTLGLLEAISAGSTVGATLNGRASDSLRVCPYPAFANGSVYATNASITDINLNYTWSIFLSISDWDGRRVKHFSFDAVDETVPGLRVYGAVAVGTAVGSAFDGRIDAGNVIGLYGNYVMMLEHSRDATGPTARITADQGAVSASFDLYRVEIDGQPKLATVSFSTQVVLPPAPSPTRCNHAAMPVADGN